MKAISKVLVVVWVCLAALFSACSSDLAYNEYQQIDGAAWHQDSVYTFSYYSTDTLSYYDVFINVRNNVDYEYQNLWLFTESLSPSEWVAKDTIECFLADNTGRWLGQSLLAIHQMPIFYMQNIRFPQEGNYTFKIAQAMREETLKGIESIGISIKKRVNEDGQE